MADSDQVEHTRQSLCFLLRTRLHGSYVGLPWKCAYHGLVFRSGRSMLGGGGQPCIQRLTDAPHSVDPYIHLRVNERLGGSSESEPNRGRPNHAAWRAHDKFAPGILATRRISTSLVMRPKRKLSTGNRYSWQVSVNTPLYCRTPRNRNVRGGWKVRVRCD
jgi:hypothetical protein